MLLLRSRGFTRDKTRSANCSAYFAEIESQFQFRSNETEKKAK